MPRQAVLVSGPHQSVRTPASGCHCAALWFIGGRFWRYPVATIALLATTVAYAQPNFNASFTPSTIGPGSVGTLTFTITNGDATPATALAFSNVLPAAVTIADPANASSDCIGLRGGTLSAPDGGNTISLGGGVVGGDGECRVSVDVTSSTVGLHMNLSGDLTSDLGNSGTVSTNLTVATDRPGFSKNFSPSSIGFGGRSTLTFTIDNSANASAVSSVSFIDKLPSGMLIASPANAATDCGGPDPMLTSTPGTDLVSFSSFGISVPGFEVLPAGATCTITVDVTGNCADTLNSVSSDLASDVGSVGKASDALEVSGGKVIVTKSLAKNPINPGDEVTLEFTISNTDRNEPATGISFTDDLDAALSGLVATGLPAANVCGAGSQLSGIGLLNLTGGNLAAGATCSFDLTLQLPAGAISGTYPSNTSAITADVGGASVVGNSAAENLFVNAVPVLTMTFLDDPAGAGGTAELEFTLTNTNLTSDATDIAFDAEFPAELATATATPTAGSCGASSVATFTPLIDPPPPSDAVPAKLAISGANLVAGTSCTFSITLDIAEGISHRSLDIVTNKITATTGGATQTGTGASASLTVLPAPTLSKSFSNDPTLPGNEVVLEFTISTAGVHEMDRDVVFDASSIAFTDDLTAALAGLTATGLPRNDVCGVGSILSGTTTLSLVGGDLVAGQSCSFSAPLLVPAAALPGSYPNTTSTITATVAGKTAMDNPAVDDLLVAGLDVTKSFSGDDPVIAGDTVTLTFTLDNTSAALDATNITFTDNLASVMPGLTLTLPPTVDTCAGTPSLIGSAFLIYAGGSLAAGSTCTIEIEVQIPAGVADGTYNSATSNPTAAMGGSTVILPPANDALVVNSASLLFSKAFIDDPVAPDDSVTLAFTIQNQDPARTITDITFTDNLDAVLTGLAAVGLPAIDVCGAGSRLSGSSLLTLTGGSLAGGAGCTFNVSLQVPGGATTGLYRNSASQVTGTLGGLTVTGDPAFDQLRVAELIFSMFFDGPSTAAGTAELNFTIENRALTAASNLAFLDDLDAVIPGLVATDLPKTGICGPGSQIDGTGLLVMTGGNLGAGESCAFSVTVQIPGTATAGTFLNTTSDFFQAGLLSTSSATADLVVEPPLTFSKNFAPDRIALGQTSTLTFTISNTAGTLVANNLDFTDSLPAGMVVAIMANSATTCSGGTLSAAPKSDEISYSGGSVAAESSCTVQVDVTASTTGELANVSDDLTSSSGNSGAANATLSVYGLDPVFSDSFEPTSIERERPATLAP